VGAQPLGDLEGDADLEAVPGERGFGGSYGQGLRLTAATGLPIG
jgi:hypothetical protein